MVSLLLESVLLFMTAVAVAHIHFVVVVIFRRPWWGTSSPRRRGTALVVVIIEDAHGFPRIVVVGVGAVVAGERAGVRCGGHNVGVVVGWAVFLAFTISITLPFVFVVTITVSLST